MSYDDECRLDFFPLYFGFGAMFPGRYMTKYWFVPERYWNEPAKNKITGVALNMLGYHIGTLVSTRSG